MAHPIRTLTTTPLKWIPHVIPLDCIPKLFLAFDKLKEMPTLGDRNKNKWSEFIIKRNKVMCITQYILAMRPGEMVGIRIDDIFKDQTDRYYIRVRGENNKVKRDRQLTIPQELAYIINWYMDNYKEQLGNSEWLFPSYHNRKTHISRYQYNDIFQRAIRIAELWRPHPTKRYRGLYTAYSLRHSRAVHLLESSNHDLWLVANILGHCSLIVTACYLHFCPSIIEYERKIMETDLIRKINL